MADDLPYLIDDPDPFAPIAEQRAALAALQELLATDPDNDNIKVYITKTEANITATKAIADAGKST